LLGPLEFLALAEEMGLGSALGDWVLSTALAESAGWRGRDDKSVPVAVNLANSQFRSPNLLDRLMQTIDTAGLSTAQVGVETTETVVLKNQLADNGLLAGLKERGLRTAIDAAQNSRPSACFGTCGSIYSRLTEPSSEILKRIRATAQSPPALST
jgi:EAL domain-containing protein (putative c-di-GMP-specific phosphodiesterase class I)